MRLIVPAHAISPVVLGPQHTSITLLPESIVARKAGLILAFLAQHGFREVWSQPFQFDVDLISRIRGGNERPHATLPRTTRTLLEMVQTVNDSLFVLLEREQTDGRDASAELSRLKGSVFPSDRFSGSLRSRIGSQHPTLKYVHCPDYFDDFIHEYSIIYQHILNSRRCISSGRIQRWIDDLYKVIPYREVEIQSAITSLQIVIDQARHHACSSALEVIEERLDNARKGLLFDFCELFDPIDHLELRVDPWDRIIVSVFLTRYDWTVELDGIIDADATYLSTDSAVSLAFTTLSTTGFHGTLDDIKRYAKRRRNTIHNI